MSAASPRALELDAVSAGYGRFDVVHDISLHVGRGEAVALLGPNGAGKTTLLRTIMGQMRNPRGVVSVGGRDVTSWPSHRIARGHAAIAPEGRRLFTDQSVEDNLVLGGLHRRRDPGRVEQLLASVYALFPVLRSYKDRPAQGLSGGEQQMVAIGRMLMSDPDILLLDEPSIALSPAYVELVAKALVALREGGASLLLVEQRVDVAMRVCDRLYVLAHGRLVEETTPAQLGRDGASLIKAYLG